MFAQVKALWWWKLEHVKETCEDAYKYDIEKGLFAVADGMSTMVFSHLWANILVNRFVNTPLIGVDPFETEWWLRPAQLEYINTSPKVETFSPLVQSKARKGSAATLATVRISTVQDNTSALAELLAFGDSCIFVGNLRERLVRVLFPIGRSSDFGQAPVGLPSLSWRYNRHFYLPNSQQVELQPDDVIILATDAVAEWIISNGANTYATTWEAFQRIVSLKQDEPAGTTPGPEGTWSHFIQQCRSAGQMVNDDMTALIIMLLKQGEEKERLGATSTHLQSVIEQRKRDFQASVIRDQKDLIAINYGDGRDLADVSYPDIERARKVADALSEVWKVFHREIHSPDIAAKLKNVLQVYGPLLVNEPSTEDLKNKLHQLGISLETLISATTINVLLPQPASPIPSPSASQTILRMKQSVAANTEEERAMLYLQSWGVMQPGCIIILLDRSGSMFDSFGLSKTIM
jgi:serine/threonine protein phosphatase PrpC